MRTAVTLGINHGGTEVLIAGRNVPIHEQKEKFQALLGKPEHPEFAEVNYQESDDGHGQVRVIRFQKPVAAVPQTKPSKK